MKSIDTKFLEWYTKEFDLDIDNVSYPSESLVSFIEGYKIAKIENYTKKENPILPSDKTFNKYLDQWELYAEAHNGYAEYLSYEYDILKQRFDESKKNNTDHLKSGVSIQLETNNRLPLTPAGKLEMVSQLLDDNIYDEDGEVIGKGKPIITVEQARKLLGIKLKEDK